MSLHNGQLTIVLLLLCVTASSRCHAANVTFSDQIAGVTSYGFDGDGDTIADVIFSTADPLGFNTSGPGPFQLFVNQPGMEGIPSRRDGFHPRWRACATPSLPSTALSLKADSL